MAEIFTLIFSFQNTPAISVPWKGERAEIATHAANQSYIHNAEKEKCATNRASWCAPNLDRQEAAVSDQDVWDRGVC